MKSLVALQSVWRVTLTFPFQDFESNPALKNMAIDFLEDILCCSAGLPALLPSEHRASSQLLRMLTKEESDRAREREDLRNVLNMGQQVSGSWHG